MKFLTSGEPYLSLGDDVEVDVRDVVDSGETIVTEIVLFQPEEKSVKAGGRRSISLFQCLICSAVLFALNGVNTTFAFDAA